VAKPVYVVLYHDDLVGVYKSEDKAREGFVMHSMYYDYADVENYRTIETTLR
jgi:hypothetical protein